MEHGAKTAVAFTLLAAFHGQACSSSSQPDTGSVVQNLSDSNDDGDHHNRDRHRHRRWQRGGSGGSQAPSAGGAAPAPGEAGAGGAAAPAAGSGGTSAAGAGGSTPANPPPSAARYQPTPGTSWQIQLQDAFASSVDVQLYDLDLFETSNTQIASLHASGKHVICYFDTAYEPDRPDSDALAPYRGNPIDGWPGQSWVDFRQPAVKDVMLARLDLAQSKGCDGVDADDVDARENDPGFDFTAADEQGFQIQLAEAAHARGLAYGLKNALSDVSALISYADFAVNEECFDYDECGDLDPFVRAGKPVFQIEYASDERSLAARASEICPRALQLGLDTLIKTEDLTAARVSCR